MELPKRLKPLIVEVTWFTDLQYITKPDNAIDGNFSRFHLKKWLSCGKGML